MSERLARMKEALFRALNPGEMDADHPTSAPRLLLGRNSSGYHSMGGFQHTGITSLWSSWRRIASLY